MRFLCTLLSVFCFSALQFFSVSGFSAPASAASQNYLVHVWQTDDGLPQNWVSSIAQTPEGYLWIGTRYGGLARFDGMRFVPFNPQNTPALLDVQVEHLSVDGAGRLWVIMGNESLTTFHDNTFTLRREPRLRPRMKPDRVLATTGDSVTFAGENTYLGRVQFAPGDGGDGGTNWTMILSRPLQIDPRSFCADGDGVIWGISAAKKIARLKNDRFELLPASAFPALTPATRFTDIDADKTGVIHATSATQLLRWDTAGGRFVDITPAGSPAPRAIAQIEFSGDNGVWVLEKERLRKALGGRWVTEITNAQLLQHAAAGNATLHGDAAGNVWLVAPGRGLWHAKSDGSSTLLDETAGLPNTFITAWLQDTEGNIWIGTNGGGIARIRESIFTTLGPAQGLPGKAVSSVCIDQQGRLWAGTMTGALAFWEGGRFAQQPLAITDEADPVAGLTVWPARAPDDALWIGSVNHGLMRLRAGQPAVEGNWQNVRILFGDSRGELWVGPLVGLSRLGADGRARDYSAETIHAVGAMAEDDSGAIWIGTGPGDLLKYDRATDTFASHTPPPEWAAGRISAVLPDADGAVWVGTLGGGLLRFHDGAFTRCTIENGLPDNSITQLLDSGDGHLWAGTFAGIFRASKDELAKVAANKTSATAAATVRIYGRFDGLPALECSTGFQPACWRSGDGTLYFSTANGVVAVNPHRVTENRIPPTVIIEEFIVDGKRVKKGATPLTKIGPGQHHVQFQITAINFTAPDGVRFRVKLDGADTDWRNIDSSRRLIGYGPLQPGRYRFHVIASNNDGVWNETGDTLAFEVLPRFYETVWFRIALPLLVLALIIAIVVRMQRQRYRRRLQRVERQRELERERTRIARDLHDDLGTSLTQISLLSALASRDQTPPAETRDLITQMDNCAHKMVTALDEIVWAVNPKNDSWYELANYLGFFAEEFFHNTNIQCRLDIPAQIPPRPIPSEVRHHIFLAVKEALNNAARHSGATQVWLRIKTDDTTAIISVEDDGGGFSRNAGARGGNGLNNMRLRMEQVGGTVDITPGPDGRGIVVTFRMSLGEP